MELIVKSFITALFVGALGLVIYVQHNSLRAAKERADHAEQATRDRDDTLKTMMEAATRKQKAAAKLQAARDDIAATLTERENLIESLLHDDSTIRTWFDTPLPDAVARLREHPAVTGADAGADSQRLPSDHTLQPAGGSAQD
ncbi:LysB family phage lysis regulatory protein [Collimonas sp. PA-H2]|uniref:Rz-like lysis system protein LysB n=1 Tax=Collimonas sp. PA-H2 TaxID=1881062 RepID=UPI000C009B3E|nr:Rz-like lysis system protein LysB [Collimonas sp. PA-H2]PFH10867.1 LysB family phage lysis regulatory protein [Collimonas sp. PA-H2]